MRIYALIFYSMLIFKFQKVFSPPVIFRSAEREGITVLPYLNSFGVILIIALVVTCYYTWVYIDHILTICWQTDRQIDIDNPEFFFCFNTCIDNQYALHRTPNAYRNTLLRIFTPSLYFECVFNDFQCVITLLRALSVALSYDLDLWCLTYLWRTLTLALAFKLQELGVSYCTCVFLVTGPFM